MRVEQVVLPALRQINRRPRLSPLLGKVLKPWNPFDPQLSVDPYPAYERARAGGPIFWQRTLNSWAVTSFELCEQALRSPMSVDRGDLFGAVSPWSKLSPDTLSTFTSSMLLVDPPDHTRLRRLVSRAFTPRTVEALEPRVAEIADELIDKVRHDPTVDLFEAMFAPLPIYVIGELLGIPEDDWPRLKAWSDEMAKFIDPINAFRVREMEAAVGEMKAALDGWISLRSDDPGDDLLSKLLQAEDEEDGSKLSRPELQSMIAILMAAGHETTSGLLGNAIVALDGRRDLSDRLATDTASVPAAVEELIRFDGAVQNTDRIALEDFELGGMPIRKGQVTVLLLGAANRDPAVFDHPDRLDFDRENVRSLSFGHGIHHCLGAALARLEMRVVLPKVCAAFPDHRVQASGIEWKSSLTLRGPVRLPIAKR